MIVKSGVAGGGTRSRVWLMLTVFTLAPMVMEPVTISVGVPLSVYPVPEMLAARSMVEGRLSITVLLDVKAVLGKTTISPVIGARPKFQFAAVVQSAFPPRPVQESEAGTTRSRETQNGAFWVFERGWGHSA